MTKHGRCERGLGLRVERRALLHCPRLGSGYSSVYLIGSLSVPIGGRFYIEQ